MSKHSRQNQKALLLDFAQQTNFGDDIMQRALINLTKKHLSEDIAVTAYYGTNEFQHAEKDFSSYKEKFDIDVKGGFASTNFKNRSSVKLISVLTRMFYLLTSFLFLLAIKLGVNNGFAKLFFSKHKRAAIEQIESADVVIWNGRNFRGSTTSILSETIKILELCVNPLVCILLGKRVYCIGSSIWPLNSAISKSVMRFVINHSSVFWVREKSSENYIRNELAISETNINCMPDLSFFVLDQVVSQQTSFEREESSSAIALTIVGRKEFLNDEIHQQYLNAMSDLVGHISSKGLTIRVIPQVTYEEEPYDKELEFIISNNPQATIEVADNGDSVEYLLSEYCKCSVLVASRMHSAIFASSCGLPITAVTYDSGAKWTILDDLGISRNLVMDSTDIDTTKLISNFNTCLENSATDAPGKALIPQLARGVNEVFITIHTQLASETSL